VPQRVDYPYWLNWLWWNLVESHRRTKVVQRRAVWEFVERVRKLPPGSVVIDGGANVGNITAACVRQGAIVHAFEPDPHAIRKLKERFAGNPLVTIHEQAVGAADGRLRLYRLNDFDKRPDRASQSSSLIPRAVHDANGGMEVAVIDLSSFIRGLGRPVDLLKLDVEGEELEILEKMIDDGTYRAVGMIYVETHERLSPDLAVRTAALRRRVAEAGITNINFDWH
jgi:FkbM family methyltransferase